MQMRERKFNICIISRASRRGKKIKISVAPEEMEREIYLSDFVV